MKQIDRTALLDWEKFRGRTSIGPRRWAVPCPPPTGEKHRRYLERHPVEWIKFFFPNYAKYEFADFQKRAIQRIIAHDEWFEVLSWSRELAKSTVSMFVVLFVTLTGRKKNVIMTSNSKDNAVRLLAPYRANLEANGRIQAYYGKQETPGSWTEDEFVTKGGVAFRAIGAGQSPRVRATRPFARTCCSWTTSTRTRTPRTRTRYRSGGTGGKTPCIRRDPSRNRRLSSFAETSSPKIAAWYGPGTWPTTGTS